ncbi:unnamed protein product, partial [Hymenolepis diminuta]
MRRIELKKSKPTDWNKIENDTQRLALMLENCKASAAHHKEISKNIHWESSRTPISKSKMNNRSIPEIKNITKIKILPMRPDGSRAVCVSKMNNDKTISKMCGQCEKILPAKFCQECREEFCTRCFSKCHLKGALKEHHPILINKLKLSKSTDTVANSIGSS